MAGAKTFLKRGSGERSWRTQPLDNTNESHRSDTYISPPATSTLI